MNDEPFRHDCFLCRPNSALLSDVGKAGYAMAGLGPLVDGYAVVATHEHLKGLEEAGSDLRFAYAEYASAISKALAKAYGACFIVEHGNMAVCGISEEGGRAHCFHPHFLMIPDPSVNVSPFLDYFGTSVEFSTLAEAANFGADRGQYVLAGEAAGPFHVFLPEGELPRQFARGLVAEQLHVVELASWRDQPNLSKTLANASALREIFSR